MLWSVMLQLILYPQICHDDYHERGATTSTLLSCCYFVTNGDGRKCLWHLRALVRSDVRERQMTISIPLSTYSINLPYAWEVTRFIVKK